MRTKILICTVMLVILISGCGGSASTQPPTEEPVAPATDASPGVTDITIDGNPSDWERYPVVVEDSVGDSTGNVDVKSIRTFTNDRFLYLLVEVEGEIGSYVQLDVDFNPGSDGWPDYMANAYPNNQDFIPHVAKIENQQFNHLQNTIGEVAQGHAFELRFPLDLFGDTPINTLRVRVMDGECCEANWVNVDETDPTRIAYLNETDALPVASVPTLVSTPEPPKETNIMIDGTVADWSGHAVAGVDPEGDAPEGTPDITKVSAILNDQYVYVLIELTEPGITGKFDLGFETSGGNPPDYFVTVWPHEERNVYTSGVGGGASPSDSITTAQDEAVEVKFPLTLLENNKIISFNVQIDLGGSVGDSVFELRVKVVDELEPAPPAYAVPVPSPTRVEFASEDGQALVGYFYPSWQKNAPVILLVHQYGLPQNNWFDYGMVAWLQNWPPDSTAHGLFPVMPVDQSFAVFTLDLRGFGESGPAIPNNLSDEEFNVWGAGWVMDVKAAVEQIKSIPGVDASHIAIIGANNGADASVAACEDCLGVLALSAGGYAGLDTKTNAGKLDAEGKVVWCFSTQNSAGSDVATCSSLTGSHNKWINFPGDGRGMQLIRDDKAPADIGQSILDFLAVVFGFGR